MARCITTKTFKRSFGHVLALVLLALYLAGASQLELIHSLAHPHDTVASHADEKEKDPCHRLIYHNDKEKGCDHDAHLIVSDKCQMCDLAFHCEQSLTSSIKVEVPKFLQQQFAGYKNDLDSYWAVFSSSRAPPTLI